ncbi:MAG: hypothetical protein K6E59_01445, partial [Bacilli bacterium]|nr:hypothetical protein [Bacilli bacterium]
QYKTTRTGIKSDDPSDNAKRKALAETIVDQLGGNATDIPADAFFARNKTENAKVVDIYNGFCRTYGVDIVASLAICAAHIYEHGQAPQQQPSKLHVTNAVTGGPIGYTDVAILGDFEATFADLIDDMDVYFDQSPCIPTVDLLDGDGAYIRKAQASDLSFIANFFVDDSRISVDVSKTDNIVQTGALYQANYMLLGLDLVRDGVTLDHAEFLLAWGEAERELEGWPTELIQRYGLEGILPVFVAESPNALAQSEDVKEGFDLYVKGVNEQEIATYLETLEASGFIPYAKGINYLLKAGDKVFTLSGEESSESLNLFIRYAPQEYKVAYSDQDKAIFAELDQDVLMREGFIFRHPSSGDPNAFHYFGVAEKDVGQFKADLDFMGWAGTKESSADVFRRDVDLDHYEIRIQRDEYSLVVSYAKTSDTPEVIDYQPLLVCVGDMEFPMENDMDGNPNVILSFGSHQTFYIIGGGQRQYRFGYSSLSADSCSKVAEGKKDTILVLDDCELKVKLLLDGKTPRILVTDPQEGGGGEEEQPFVATVQRVHFERAFLTGSFSNWDLKETSYELLQDEVTGAYSIVLYLDEGAEFKLTFDFSWNNCLGFAQMPVFAGYPELFAGKGEESNVLVLKPVTITLGISEMQGDSMQLSLLAKAS